MDPASLIIPAFIAGLLTFLAPCTLPLVPGYLAFISGIAPKELSGGGNESARRKMFLSGVFFAVGFSVVFILFGSLAGLGGRWLFAYQEWLNRIGGLVIILFGAAMLVPLEVGRLRRLSALMGVAGGRLPFVQSTGGAGLFAKHFASLRGSQLGACAFGAAFAVGWTPCVGPVLGAMLTLAASSATVWQGAFLLGVFSLGLAIPFLIVASGAGFALRFITKIGPYLFWANIIGGILLVIFGAFLFFGSLGQLISFAFRALDFIGYGRLMEYF